jgi:Protein of unknown function (DUF3754)
MPSDLNNKLTGDPVTPSNWLTIDQFLGENTSGWISPDAPHWAIEPYLPADEPTIARWLANRVPSVPYGFWTRFDRQLNLELDTWCGRQHRVTRLNYSNWDPDLSYPPSKEKLEEKPATKVFEDIHALATAAGYKKISREEIQDCIGVSSSIGIPVYVDLNLFEQVECYARGEVIGHRVRRRWQGFYRRQIIDIPVYQRMIVAFRLKADQPLGRDSSDMLISSAIHLRLFKNIPKQDIDMLLPGGTVRISGFDRVKIVLPSLGGFLLSLRKIAQLSLLLAALAMHWVAILIALMIGYAIKSTISYFQTRNRYELNLNRHLYFQKLDTNAGVLATLVDDAVTQRRCEAMLLFHALATIEESPASTRKLKRRCERYVRESCGVEMDFQVARALTLLVDCDLAENVQGRWRPRDLPQNHPD